MQRRRHPPPQKPVPPLEGTQPQWNQTKQHPHLRIAQLLEPRNELRPQIQTQTSPLLPTIARQLQQTLLNRLQLKKSPEISPARWIPRPQRCLRKLLLLQQRLPNTHEQQLSSHHRSLLPPNLRQNRQNPKIKPSRRNTQNSHQTRIQRNTRSPRTRMLPLQKTINPLLLLAALGKTHHRRMAQVGRSPPLRLQKMRRSQRQKRRL